MKNLFIRTSLAPPVLRHVMHWRSCAVLFHFAPVPIINISHDVDDNVTAISDSLSIHSVMRLNASYDASVETQVLYKLWHGTEIHELSETL